MESHLILQKAKTGKTFIALPELHKKNTYAKMSIIVKRQSYFGRKYHTGLLS